MTIRPPRLLLAGLVVATLAISGTASAAPSIVGAGH